MSASDSEYDFGVDLFDGSDTDMRSATGSESSGAAAFGELAPEPDSPSSPSCPPRAASAAMAEIGRVREELVGLQAEMLRLRAARSREAARSAAHVWMARALGRTDRDGAAGKELARRAWRVAYETGLAGESATRLLFRLDAVSGGDEVRQRRRALVRSAAALAERADAERKDAAARLSALVERAERAYGRCAEAEAEAARQLAAERATKEQQAAARGPRPVSRRKRRAVRHDDRGLMAVLAAEDARRRRRRRREDALLDERRRIRLVQAALADRLRYRRQVEAAALAAERYFGARRQRVHASPFAFW